MTGGHSTQGVILPSDTVSIPEVILQSAFSRSVISLSKQKRMNAHGHNSATSYFDDVPSGAFYS